MSDNATPEGGESQELPALDQYECRILGVLVEKAKTTPDAYPLSLNALTTGCNQKSNRDPVMNLEEIDVEDTLEGLQKKGLVTRITGSGRVVRWRHNLYDAWNVGKVELAILAELLLRGGQTVGELRTRASRMEEIADLDALRDYLEKLAQRKLVVWLSPPGQRGAKVTHGFLPANEIERLKQHQGTGPLAAPVVQASRLQSDRAGETPAPPERPPNPVSVSSVEESLVARLEETVQQAQGEIAQLRSDVSELRQTLASIAEDMKKLKEELGV